MLREILVRWQTCLVASKSIAERGLSQLSFRGSRSFGREITVAITALPLIKHASQRGRWLQATG